MMLSKWFTKAECVVSETAVRYGIKNVPTEDDIARIKLLLINVMDRVRDIVKSPITPTSVFRNYAINKLVGGEDTSQHLWGEACDFLPLGWTVKNTIKAILNNNIEFDQLIDEYGAWVHVSYTKRKPNRNQILVFRKVNGKTKRTAYTREQYLRS